MHQHTIEELQARMNDMQVQSDTVNKERTYELKDSERNMNKEKEHVDRWKDKCQT